MITAKTPEIYFNKNATCFYVCCECYGYSTDFIETDNEDEAKEYFNKAIRKSNVRYVYAHYGNFLNYKTLAVYTGNKGIIKNFVDSL